MTMSGQMNSVLPVIYRFTFLWYEPIGCLAGLYVNIFDPDHFIRLYVPGAVRNPAHDILHSYIAGAMVSFAIIQAVLLRYTDDVNVWKIVNAGMIAWEVCILRGCYNALVTQGRLAVGTWRADDWISVSLPALIGVIRVLYVAGLGIDRGSAAKPYRDTGGVPSKTDRARTA